MKNLCSTLFVLLFISCSTHQRSNIKASETFVVQLEKPASRGIVEIGIQGLLLGANYFAEKSANSLISTYNETLSVNDYYDGSNGKVKKNYNKIHIKKYSKPNSSDDNTRVKNIITQEIAAIPESRADAKKIVLEDVIRVENDDILNFEAVIELVSDSENPGVTRLSFNELRVFFSKTKVYNDENLNARISVAIEGEWRAADGSPMQKTLVEQEYDFKNLKYGPDNQIKEPVLSPWYYDIPINPELESQLKFGIVKIKIRVEEYEGKKSKYVSKLPGLLSDNKDSVIKSGASTINKLMNN